MYGSQISSIVMSTCSIYTGSTVCNSLGEWHRYSDQQRGDLAQKFTAQTRGLKFINGILGRPF